RRRTNDPRRATMVGGGGVILARESVVIDAEFFIAVDARRDENNPRNEAIVRLASAIEERWLEECFPEQIQRQRRAEFDESSGRVIGIDLMKYRNLVLREERSASISPDEATRVLALALAPRAREIVERDESAASLLARIALL